MIIFAYISTELTCRPESTRLQNCIRKYVKVVYEYIKDNLEIIQEILLYKVQVRVDDFFKNTFFLNVFISRSLLDISTDFISIFPPDFNPNQYLIYKIQSELKSNRFNL